MFGQRHNKGSLRHPWDHHGHYMRMAIDNVPPLDIGAACDICRCVRASGTIWCSVPNGHHGTPPNGSNASEATHLALVFLWSRVTSGGNDRPTRSSSGVVPTMHRDTQVLGAGVCREGEITSQRSVRLEVATTLEITDAYDRDGIIV